MGRSVSEKNANLDEAIRRELDSPDRLSREKSLSRLWDKITAIKSEQRLTEDGAWAMVRGRIATSPAFKDETTGLRTTISMRQEILFQWRVQTRRPDSKQVRSYIPADALRNRQQRRVAARQQANAANDAFAGCMTHAPFIPADFREAMLKVAEENEKRIDEALPPQKNGSKP